MDAGRATGYQFAIAGQGAADPGVNNQAALDYLRACAVPICILETDAVCTFRLKFDPNVVVTLWVREEQRAALLKRARHDASRAPDAATAEAAPRGAAGDRRVVLTAHSVARGRVGDGVATRERYIAIPTILGALFSYRGVVQLAKRHL